MAGTSFSRPTSSCPTRCEAVAANGAEGIGLYRTEFLYLNRDDAPGGRGTIRNLPQGGASSVAPHPLIIRTFDLGGDKIAGAVEADDELNPFLGWRAIRFCLEHPDIFKAQLRAILRASAVGQRQRSCSR